MRLQAIEVKYSNGAPSGVYADYQRMLGEHNAMIDPYNTNVARYKGMYSDYSARIDKYNAMVDQANSLSKKLGSTWVIVPVPRLGSRN